MFVRFDTGAWHHTRWHEYLTRFFFGGAVTVLAGLIAQKFGPAIGGLFLAFPAIFPATASLIEKRQRDEKRGSGIDGTRRGRLAAGVDAAGSAMGSVGLIGFAIVCWRFLRDLPPWLTISGATMLWAAVSAAVWFVRKRQWRRIKI